MSDYDQRRGSSAQRGYGYKWQKARAAYLAKHPLCIECQKTGHIKAANVVDHIVPHRGDMKIFWDSANWAPLCDHHHNSWKQRLEKSGTVLGADQDGVPIDEYHHWNT